MTYAVQSEQGAELNRFYENDQSIHEWYRFVLSYPPHLVRHYIERFGIEEGQCVLDPFCGTGTTLVECKKRNISSVGIEANPMAKFATQVKTGWKVDPDELRGAARVAVRMATTLSKESNRIWELDEHRSRLLIKDSICPVPLSKTLMLLDAIDREKNMGLNRLMRLALARQAVHAYSNLHFGPEVGVSKTKKEDAPVFELWLDQIEKMGDDIKAYARMNNPPAHVVLGDARDFLDLLPENSIDAVITSPPYPNEKDYSRTTRLESVLLGFLPDKIKLRDTKRCLIRSNTRNIYRDDEDAKWIEGNKRVEKLAQRIESRRIQLRKTSGFERSYHKVVLHYFGGMARHLSTLSKILRPGAQLAYVVGDQASYFRVLIRTGEILSGIAEELGYLVKGIDPYRTRQATATRSRLREEVVILQWRG